MGKLKNLSAYSKFLTAIMGQGLTFASQYYGSNHWVTAATAIAAALGVYAIPNTGRTLPPVTPPV